MRKWRMNLQLFSEGQPADGQAAGGGGTGSPNANPGGQPGGGAGQDSKPFAVFPDSASFTARLDREAKSRLEAMAKELGFELAEALQTAAKAQKAAAEAARTDLEKEKAAREKAESEAKAAKEQARQTLIRAELKLRAQAAGALNPEAVYRLADLSGVTVDEKTGEVKGIDEALKALQKSDAYLFGKPGSVGVGSPGSPGGGAANLSPEEEGRKIAEERNKAAAERTKARGFDPWAQPQ